MNNKEKRRRQSTSESNNSFVKNVTTRVSGFLPARITKWFSSPRSSDANGSTPTADATDSSTEDEDPESPVTAQPPAKRMRYGSPGKNSSQPVLMYMETTSSTSNIEITELPNAISTIQSPPGRNTFRRETNFVSTPIQSPNDDSQIEKSESENTILKTQTTVSAIGQSVAAKRKSIFDSPTNKQKSLRACAKTSYNTMRDPNKPSFKLSMFGSPFYPGQTMYGGAASTYINQPNIQHRKAIVVNEAQSDDNCMMSQSAKRIMDLLEHYSSPIMEAKRIPSITRSTPYDSINSSIDSLSRSADKVLSNKTQELLVPSIASILRLKKRSRLMDATNAARQLIASYSSVSEFQPYISNRPTRAQTETEPSNHKSTPKVKSRLTRPCRGDNHNDLPIPVKLPTGILQIEKDNLPKFSFENPGASKPTSDVPAFPLVTSNSTLPSYESMTFTKKAQAPTCTVTSNSSNNIFKFSSPVPIPYESQQTSTPQKFTFGSPERGIDNPEIKKKDDDHSIVVDAIKESGKSDESNDWKCPECWVFNNTNAEKCVCCGNRAPSNNNVGKLANSQTLKNNYENMRVPVNNIKLPGTHTSNSLKWKCEDCWVNNDESAEKCACCGSGKTKKSSAADVVPKITTKVTDGDWKCDDCWVTNKGSVEKCAACGGSKPGAKKNTKAAPPLITISSSLFKPPDNKLTDIVKSQKSGNKWECSSCLVRNENDKTTCVCCGTDREGLGKDVENKSFNFGMNTNITFKFGIDPNVQAATLPKTESMFTTPVKKVEESETNNNVLAKTPTFTFTLPVKKPVDQTTSAKEKTEETPKMNFMFGIRKNIATEKVVANKLTAPEKKVTDIETEKPHEVPKVDHTSPAQAKPKTLAGFFNTPLYLKPAQVKPLTTGSLINKDKEETVSIPAKIQSDAENVKQQNTFSFTASSIKPSMNIFGSPPSTAVTGVNSLKSPLQSALTTTASVMSMFNKPETGTLSSISLFQKNGPATTCTVTLFQKNDSVSTAVTAASDAITAPIFSFGNNKAQTQSSAPASAPEKPKFNFTFGNNTDSTSLFKSSFGSSADNAASSTKFTLSASTQGNSIGSGIQLSGNPQGGNNGQPAVTTLAGSPALGGNGLPTGKPLGGSELANNNNSTLPTAKALTTETTSGGGSSGILFGTPFQKENLWANKGSTNNMFVPNTTASNLQKPATFTFGSSTPFTANNTTIAFGGGAQTTQNVFGISNHNTNSQPSMFPTAASSQSTPHVFGTPQPASNPAPSLSLFGTPNVGATPTFGGTPNVGATPTFGGTPNVGATPTFGGTPNVGATPTFGGTPNVGATPTFGGTPNVGATPTFGTPNPTIPSFETPSLTPAPAPAFNFGAPQSTAIFGFGQQQQQQPQQQPQTQQAGMYNFGAAAVGAPQVQFNMGSAPNTAMRRVRKAVRRHPQR